MNSRSSSEFRSRTTKIKKITPGKERCDIKIKDYVVLHKPQGQDNSLVPPRTLIMDFTMTHVRFGRSQLHPIGPDGVLKESVRIKIRHYRNIYLNRPDPMHFYR